MFVSAPENVAWLLNIRGSDNPNSPIPNCRLILSSKNKFFLISNKSQTKKLIAKKRLNNHQIINYKDLNYFFDKLKGKKIIIDKKAVQYFLKI